MPLASSKKRNGQSLESVLPAPQGQKRHRLQRLFENTFFWRKGQQKRLRRGVPDLHQKSRECRIGSRTTWIQTHILFWPDGLRCDKISVLPVCWTPYRSYPTVRGLLGSPPGRPDIFFSDIPDRRPLPKRQADSPTYDAAKNVTTTLAGYRGFMLENSILVQWPPLALPGVADCFKADN